MLTAPQTVDLIQPVPDYTGPAAPPPSSPPPSSNPGWRPLPTGQPASAPSPPTTVVGDPVIIGTDVAFSHPTSTLPLPLSPGAPSIGYGYTPSAVGLTVNVPNTAPGSSSPTTLSTVTTWASSLPAHWQAIAAVIVVVVLLIAYRRSRG